MALPPLVRYGTEAEYREHYKRHYCRRDVRTTDGLRVYFNATRFEHAFYEGRGKYRFSPVRAQRIDWISATLAHPDAALYQGWNKDAKIYVPDRRVSVIYEDFVVVISLRLRGDNSLKGSFVTAYQADNSITKIRTSPRWALEECLNALRREGGR